MSVASQIARDSDVVYTPRWIVQDMLAHFRPTGIILDPCRGEGAFHDLLPPGSPWCEISEGVDFFRWSQPVDWAIGNPPYSITRAWLRHSYLIAAHVLYLIPLRNLFGGYGTIREARTFGGVPHIRLYGTGTTCGFPMGNAIGAIHIQRGYDGPTTFSDYAEPLW